jgi:hypothetical protein
MAGAKDVLAQAMVVGAAHPWRGGMMGIIRNG